MKNYQSHLPFFLLLSYTVYSCFVPINIAHSIVLFSLAVSASYHSYLSSQKATKHNEEVLRELKVDFDSKLIGIKEAHEKKISRLEDETAKLALNTMPSKPVSSSSPGPRKVMF